MVAANRIPRPENKLNPTNHNSKSESTKMNKRKAEDQLKQPKPDQPNSHRHAPLQCTIEELEIALCGEQHAAITSVRMDLAYGNTATSIRALVRVLCESANCITQVDLRDNDIDDDAFQPFIEMLWTNKLIERVDVSGNALTNYSILELGAMIRNGKSAVSHMDVSENDTNGDRAVLALTAELEKARRRTTDPIEQLNTALKSRQAIKKRTK